jgi:ABC-type polysaccharide/polyol phosphate export permease
MPQPTATVDGAFRALRTIHFAMMLSVLLYIWMAEKVLQHNQRTPDRLFTTLIGLVAATMFLAAIVVRMKIVQPAVDLLQTNPDDRQSVVRWRSGSIISFVLAETVILFGLAMRVSGLGRNQTIPFYVAAVVLMIFLRPRRQ